MGSIRYANLILEFRFCFQMGEVSDVRIIRDFKGRSKGFAYVEFKDEVRTVRSLELPSPLFRLLHSFVFCNCSVIRMSSALSEIDLAEWKLEHLQQWEI